MGSTVPAWHTHPAALATLRRMKRRGTTVLIGAILVAGLIYLVIVAPLPYAAFLPGPAFDALGQADGQDVIQVSGAPATPSKGQLRFLTVGVQPQLTLAQALVGWISGDDAVIPIDLVI